MIIIDASIAVKWFLPEGLSQAATGLLTCNKKLLAPSILLNEVTSAIAKASRLERVKPEEAMDMITRWVGMLDRHIISLIDTKEIFDKAVCLCLELKHPFHDCFYLAAALQFNTSLATTDKRLIEQANKIDVDIFCIY